MDKDTIITVGVTREDEYGNLLVTAQGSSDEIKIAAKRSNLHPLFEQGRAVMLHWETYRDHPYISDAKLVEGELPAPQEPMQPAPAGSEPLPLPHEISGAEIGRCWNAIDTLYVHDKLQALFGKENTIAILKYYRGVLQSTLKLPVDGKLLPTWDTKKEG